MPILTMRITNTIGENMSRGASITESEKAFFVANYATMSNPDIAAALAITLHRVKYIQACLGCTKSAEFLKTQRQKAAYGLQKTNRLKGYKGQRARALQQHRDGILKGSENPYLQYIASKTEEQRVEIFRKHGETLSKLYKSEKARVLYGLEQRTNLRIVEPNPARTKAKSNLKKRGYTFVEKWLFAYDQNTKREKYLEQRYAEKFKFKFMDHGTDNTHNG